MNLSVDDVLPNVSFKTSRSGGKGGQHVNKVSSRVELNFAFEESPLFTDAQKLVLRQRLANRLSADGQLQIVTDETRSQLLNKHRSLDKLLSVLKNALHIPKSRKATKPGKSAIEARLKNKQARALKKLNRRGGRLDF
jgi:ribosome-associated protein